MKNPCHTDETETVLVRQVEQGRRTLAQHSMEWSFRRINGEGYRESLAEPIQSHVVFGCAGNSAAVFPMRRLGMEVWPVNTVQFSNHTQYAAGWQGMAMPAGHISALCKGLGDIEVLGRRRLSIFAIPSWATRRRGA